MPVEVTRWLGFLRTLLGALGIAATAGLAYYAGAKATHRREQAERDRAEAASVTAGTRKAREALRRAEHHASAADAAYERAEKGIERLAIADPTVAEIVDSWHRGPAQ